MKPQMMAQGPYRKMVIMGSYTSTGFSHEGNAESPHSCTEGPKLSLFQMLGPRVLITWFLPRNTIVLQEAYSHRPQGSRVGVSVYELKAKQCPRWVHPASPCCQCTSCYLPASVKHWEASEVDLFHEATWKNKADLQAHPGWGGHRKDGGLNIQPRGTEKWKEGSRQSAPLLSDFTQANI